MGLLFIVVWSIRAELPISFMFQTKQYICIHTEVGRQQGIPVFYVQRDVRDDDKHDKVYFMWHDARL